jgi:hypothetical protein
MAYLGNAPARSFISFERQVFTIVNSQTAYTLSHSVNNENDIRLVINNIVQEPGSGKAYTASGTTLTLSAALTNGTDEMYCVFLGRAVATNAPGAGSVNTAAIAADAVTEAKIADSAVENEHLNVNVITGQTAETSIATDDTILIHDTSASALRKMTRANFVSGIGGTMTPSFSVKKSSNQTIAGTTSTKMELDSEIFDTDNKYDSSTNFRFLPGVAGKYFLSLASSFQNFPSDKIMSVSIKKNGSGLSTFNNISGSYSDDFTAATSVIDEANTTDYYEAFIFHRASSSQTMIGSVSIFSGFKIIE